MPTYEEGGIARILVTLASSHYPHDCTVADWLLRGAGSSLVSPTAVCFSVIVLEGCSAFIVFLLAFWGGYPQHGARTSLAADLCHGSQVATIVCLTGPCS